MNVRRLAAIDMYGTKGTARRRRIIVAEFVIGLTVMVAIGILLAVWARSPGTRVFGLWTLTAGLNYAPLAAYALALRRPGALEAELSGVDTDRELRQYGVLQLWILVPLALVVFALAPRTVEKS